MCITAKAKPILTPRFIPCCTDQLMEELWQIRMTYGIPVQSHLSESPGEIDFVRFLRPDNAFYGDAYNDYDLFGKNDDINTDVKTVMAHCVWSTPEEVELMRKNGVFAAFMAVGFVFYGIDRVLKRKGSR